MMSRSVCWLVGLLRLYLFAVMPAHVVVCSTSDASAACFCTAAQFETRFARVVWLIVGDGAAALLDLLAAVGPLGVLAAGGRLVWATALAWAALSCRPPCLYKPIFKAIHDSGSNVASSMRTCRGSAFVTG